MNSDYTILVVDDESINRLLLISELRRQGFSTEEAVNGEEALARVLSGKPDLVLLDVMMPKMNGFDVCRVLKEDGKTRDIPVILITALSSRKDVEQGIAAGADEFISKPVDINELNLRIRTLLKIREMDGFIQKNSVISKNLEQVAREMESRHVYRRQAEELIMNILSLNIRSASEEKEKPQKIFVSLKLQNVDWPGRLFQWKEGGLQWEDGDLRVNTEALDRLSIIKENVYISNWQSFAETREEYHALIKETFPSIETAIDNFIYIENNHQRILLFNFGRELRPYDLTWYAHLIRYTFALSVIFEQMGLKEEEYIELAQSLSKLTEMKENAPGKHERIRKICEIVCRELRCSRAYTELLKDAVRIFDAGKALIDEAILLKEGPLTQEEWQLIHKVPVLANKLFEDLPRLTLAKEIGGSIYEKFDGSGYPFGRKGEEIPLSARIVSIANIYDVLRADRSYRKAYTHEQALRIITEGDERIDPEHFDPKMVEIFKKTQEEIKNLYQEVSPLDPS